MTGSESVSRKTPILVSVQVLRAVAALLVVVHHAGFDADTIAARRGLVRLNLESVFDWSFGIHLFFVISGFIILQAARDFATPGAPWRFMVRRVIRVVPLYWLMTTLVLVGALALPQLLNVPIDGLALIVGSYFFIPVLRAGEIRPVLGQGWSLDFEMFFYLLFAAAMALPRRLGLTLLAVLFVGLAVLHRLTGLVTPPWAAWSDPLILEFLLGLGLGLIYQSGLRLGWLAAGLLLGLGVAGAVVLGPITGRFEAVEPWIRGGLPSAALLGGCVLARPPRRPMGHCRAAAVFGPAFVAIGDASYSLYLSHPFVIRVGRALWLSLVKYQVPVALFAVLAFVAAVLAGLLLYRFIERPMTVALQRGVTGRRAVPAEPAESSL